MKKMKEKLFTLLCVVAMFVSILVVPALPAMAFTEDGSSKECAISVSYGKEYTKNWEDYGFYWNKVTVSKRGVLTIKVTKPYGTQSYNRVDITVMDKDSNVIYDGITKTDEDNLSYSIIKIGLNPGEYYICSDMISITSSDRKGRFSKFIYNFTETNDWEVEPNNNSREATVLSLNKMVTANINYRYSDDDFFKIIIPSSGSNYKIYFDNYYNTIYNNSGVSLKIISQDDLDAYGWLGGTYISNNMNATEDPDKVYYKFDNVEKGTYYLLLSNDYQSNNSEYSIGVYESPVVNVSYRTHVQSYGWQGYVSNGTVSGTSGKGKRLEAINISVNGISNLGIQYTTHCQSYGWLPWSSNGEMNGTEGEAKRLEAIKIQLTGANKDKFDVYYRVHAQSYGWLGWAKNGAPAGTAGYGKRLEAIQIIVVNKGESINSNYGNIKSVRNEAYISSSGSTVNVSGVNATNVAYRTHVQSYGWQGWKYNGQMSGTSGQAKRLEGINIKLTNKQYSGSIVYTTHVQTYGLQGNINNPSTWMKDGQMAGTSGQAKRLEAICIKLTGEMEKHYDVYYRVHAQSFGWLGWAKNGAPSGTAGYAKRLEGIQIVLVPKGGSAPASNYGGVSANRKEAYISK